MRASFVATKGASRAIHRDCMQVVQPLVGSLVAKDRLTDDRVYVKLADIG